MLDECPTMNIQARDFAGILPGRLMNPKELAVDLVMGFPNFKRNEVLMKTDAAMRNKKVAPELKF
ncbi:hypothetical protein LINGRAHAP2_LOCUS10191 [Linum grandiflorum]